jgi:hypothetical protein
MGRGRRAGEEGARKPAGRTPALNEEEAAWRGGVSGRPP